MSSLVPVLFGAIVISLIALWLYALISAIKNERLDPNMRLIWVLVIILVNGLGALLYLLIAPDRPSAGEQMLAEWNRRKRMGQ
jgi:cobalamin synthase